MTTPESSVVELPHARPIDDPDAPLMPADPEWEEDDAPEPETREPRRSEIHICRLDDDTISLCGVRRNNKKLKLGEPARDATCVICLDLLAGESHS